MSLYKSTLKSLLYHLRYHLSPEAFRSRKNLKELRGSCKGRKAVIMCNGPSLLETDFEALEQSGVVVIGLNKINLLFDKATLRPDFIVAVNRHVIEQNAEFFNETEIPLFLSCQNHLKIKKVKPRPSVTHLMTNELGRGPQEDITWAIHEGSTVTTPAMQLALHLGCSEIALIGCDHNFATKGEPNKAVTAEKEDPNHFDPNYFSGGVTWQLPDLLGSEVSYMRVLRLAESIRVKIWNCTPEGELKLFEKRSLESYLLKIEKSH
ncbi:DUF115 domain-containing protein [Akkermansiaceae bacterium]|nr:DUF115 domain-containing protein [Akkermansiaceae bacterium]